MLPRRRPGGHGRGATALPVTIAGCAVVATHRELEVVHLDDGAAASRGVEELEAERPALPRQQLELVRDLSPLLLEPADLGQLRLRLPRLRLLVAEPLHEAVEPRDV